MDVEWERRKLKDLYALLLEEREKGGTPRDKEDPYGRKGPWFEVQDESGRLYRDPLYDQPPLSDLPHYAFGTQQEGVSGFGNFFNVPGVSAQPNLTQQQIQKFAREFSPPGVRDVFTGQQPAGLRFPISGFQLPSPQLLGALEPEERTAFNTRIGIEGFSPGAVEHSIRQRFGGTRQRPRARQAPRSGF